MNTEAIAKEFSGVGQILLTTEQSTDETAAKICRDIAQALMKRVQFPGEIKVTVIRETRFVETAK